MSTIMKIMNDEKYQSLDEETKAKLTIAVSMKMVNSVYDQIIQHLALMVVHEDAVEELLDAFENRSQDYQDGWNSGVATMLQLLNGLKYSRDDIDEYATNYMEMLNAEQLDDENPGDNV